MERERQQTDRTLAVRRRHDCCKTWQSDVLSLAGAHTHHVKLHYQEDGGNAYIHLNWQQVANPCGGAEPGWFTYQDSCYWMGSEGVGWGDNACPAGTHLASIHTEDQLHFIRGAHGCDPYGESLCRIPMENPYGESLRRIPPAATRGPAALHPRCGDKCAALGGHPFPIASR